MPILTILLYSTDVYYRKCAIYIHRVLLLCARTVGTNKINVTKIFFSIRQNRIRSEFSISSLLIWLLMVNITIIPLFRNPKQTRHPFGYIHRVKYTLVCPLSENATKNNRKEKWDASGGNEVLGRVTASIPDSTKSMMSGVFKREHLRGVTVYFGIGEERPFYIEKNPSLLLDRLKHNFTFFYLNYLLLTAILFCLTLLISPSAIIGIAILGAAWFWLIRSTQANGSLQIYSKFYCMIRLLKRNFTGSSKFIASIQPFIVSNPYSLFHLSCASNIQNHF